MIPEKESDCLNDSSQYTPPERFPQPQQYPPSTPQQQYQAHYYPAQNPSQFYNPQAQNTSFITQQHYTHSNFQPEATFANSTIPHYDSYSKSSPHQDMSILTKFGNTFDYSNNVKSLNMNVDKNRNNKNLNQLYDDNLFNLIDEMESEATENENNY